MKKFGGVILTAIGALLAVLALLTIQMAVKDTMTWGGDSTIWPVSYTHLDVYKRQPPYGFFGG